MNSFRSITLGETELTLVPDGEALRPSGEGVYGVPTSAGWGEYTPPGADGTVALMPHSLLVRGPGGIALVDTGGEHPDEVPGRRSDFMENLAALGVAPGDVTTVVITHAHLDHVGYNTRLGKRGTVPLCAKHPSGRPGKAGLSPFSPTFPRAGYHMQEKEVEAARGLGGKFWDRYFRPVEEAGLLRIVTGDEEVAEGLTCLATPGHTPGHQSAMIDCGAGGRATYLGDLAVTRLHLENPDWTCTWAWSHEAERRSKARVIALALAHDALLIFGHDPHCPWGRLVREAEGVKVVPSRTVA